MHHTPLIALLVVGFVLAFILGGIALRLKLSPLVGYLLAGVLVGPFTPGYVADTSLAVELAELGVILLMFGVGLHFSLGDLLSVKHIAIPGALAQILVATLMGMGMSWMLGWPILGGFVFGLALSVASTVVLLRALEERKLVETPRGKIAVGWLIVEDLAMVAALVLLPAIAEAIGGEQQGYGELIKTLALTIGKVEAFVALMLIVGRRVIPLLLQRVVRTGSRELFTLCVLSVALGVAFGSAKLFGVSFALGAFFAGMVLNESEFSHEAARDSLPLRDAFAVLFFVSVGMLFDPSVLLRAPLQILAVFGIIVLGKSLAALIIVRAFGHPLSTALTIAVSLAQIGEFSFILMDMGIDLKLVPTEARDYILAGAILSIAANPLFFVALDRYERRRAGAHTPLSPAVAFVKDHIVLVGFGRVGSMIGATLRGRPVVVVETQDDPADAARELDFPVVRGNALMPELLARAGIARASMLLVAVPNALEAAVIIQLARKVKPDLDIVARAHSESDEQHLLASGASRTVMGEREIARCMAELAGGGAKSEPVPVERLA